MKYKKVTQLVRFLLYLVSYHGAAVKVHGREGNGSAAMLAAKRLAGVTSEVNLREHVICTPLLSANKGAQSCFETQRRRH